MQLYLGLDSSRFPNAIHYPVIRTELILSEPLQAALSSQSYFTHFIFTSKSSVRYWSEINASNLDWIVCLKKAVTIAIGTATASELQQLGVDPLICIKETQEGVIELLEKIDLKNQYVFYPHSKKARSLLSDFLKAQRTPFFSLELYNTVIQKLEPIPSLASIREIIFTSPSTVEGFFDIFKGEPLENKKLNCIGPVTENALAKILSYSNRSK